MVLAGAVAVVVLLSKCGGSDALVLVGVEVGAEVEVDVEVEGETVVEDVGELVGASACVVVVAAFGPEGEQPEATSKAAASKLSAAAG